MRFIAHIRAAVVASVTTVAIVLPATHVLAHDYEVGTISIGHPWTRATPPGAAVGGGYLTLTNDGDDADRLTGGVSPVAERVEVHTMDMDQGVMKMRKLDDGVEIPAGETVELAPGGIHIMLIGLKEPIAEGDMVPVTLQFEDAGEVDVEFAAGPIGAPTPEGHGDMDMDNADSGSHQGH